MTCVILVKFTSLPCARYMETCRRGIYTITYLFAQKHHFWNEMGILTISEGRWSKILLFHHKFEKFRMLPILNVPLWHMNFAGCPGNYGLTWSAFSMTKREFYSAFINSCAYLPPGSFNDYLLNIYWCQSSPTPWNDSCTHGNKFRLNGWEDWHPRTCFEIISVWT